MKTHALALIAGLTLAAAARAQDAKPDADKMEAAVKRLAAKLNLKQQEACLYALSELADLGPRASGASKAIVALFDSSNEEIRIFSALALGKIGHAAVPFVVERLADADPEVRFYAVWSLGLIGPAAAREMERVASLLADRDAGVRRKALFALAQMKTSDKAVLGAMAQALSDADKDVRDDAGEALIEIGPAAAAPTHRRLLDEDASTRLLACAVLGRLAAAHSAAMPFLADALFHEDTAVQYMAAHSLSQRDSFDTHTVLALGRGLRDYRGQTRERCAQALQRAGAAAGPTVPMLLEAIYDRNYGVAVPAWRALKECGHDPRPMLHARLKHDDRMVRLDTARILQDLAGEGKETVATLRAIVDEGSLAQRVEAVLLLSRTGAEKRLHDALEWMVHLEDAALRDQVIEAVGNLLAHDASAAPLLVHFLGDRSAERRWRAADMLSRMKKGDKTTERALLGRLDDPNDSVSYRALQALEAQSADVEACYPAIRKMLLEDKRGPAFSSYLMFSAQSKEWLHSLFFKGMEDEDARMRQHMIRMVTYRSEGKKEFVTRLGKAAREDADKGNRLGATLALLQVADAAHDELLVLMRDRDAEVAEQATVGMRGSPNSPRVVKSMIALLGEKDAVIRRRAAYVLGFHGVYAEPALAALRAASKDADASVAQAARDSVANIEAALAARTKSR